MSLFSSGSRFIERSMAASGLAMAVAHRLVDRAHQARDGLGLSLTSCCDTMHAVAVQLDAAVGVVEPADVLVGIHALRHQVHVAGDGEHAPSRRRGP